MIGSLLRRAHSTLKKSEQNPTTPAIWPSKTRAMSERSGANKSPGRARTVATMKIMAPTKPPKNANPAITELLIIEPVLRFAGILSAAFAPASSQTMVCAAANPHSAPIMAASNAPANAFNTTRFKSAAFHPRARFTRFPRRPHALRRRP